MPLHPLTPLITAGPFHAQVFVVSSRLLRCLRTPRAEPVTLLGTGGVWGWQRGRPGHTVTGEESGSCLAPGNHRLKAALPSAVCLARQFGKAPFLLFFKKAAESHLLLLARPPAAATENKRGGRSGDKTRGGNPAGLGRPLRLEDWGHPNLVAGACGSQRRLLCSLLPSPPPCLSLPMQTEAPCTSLPSWLWFS